MVCYFIPELFNLRQEVRLSKHTAYAASTRNNFATQSKAFWLFCLYFGRQPVPVAEDTLCLYAQFLARSFKTVNSIKSYLNVIKIIHNTIGESVTGFGGCQLKLTLKGIARTLNTPPNQAQPLTAEILLAIKKKLNLRRSEDLVFWAALLIGFFSLARISNLVATYSNAFQVLRGQIKIAGSVMLLVFTKTKTIQFGERALKVPLVAIPGSPLCPVSAYQQMVSTIPAPDTAAAFSHVVAGELKPYTYSKFQKKLKSAITAIGKDPRLYSSHSMRRGGATSAFEAGVQTSVIQTQGDWATDTYLGYVRMPHADRLNLAESMVNYVQDSTSCE